MRLNETWLEGGRRGSYMKYIYRFQPEDSSSYIACPSEYNHVLGCSTSCASSAVSGCGGVRILFMFVVYILSCLRDPPLKLRNTYLLR